MAQRGGFVIGMVVGLLIGLALALGVALYITKAPMPFINKVPQRTAEQDSAEVERNKRWDPNAPLSANGPQRAASGAVAAAVPVPVPTSPPSAQPASSAFGPPVVPPYLPPPAAQRPSARAPDVASGADPFVYFVQAGAYSRSEDAEQQRARLALAGLSARITERDQAGRTVYRVRMGPYNARNDADSLHGRLQEQSIESQIVRVEKP